MSARKPKVFEGFEIWLHEQKMWAKYVLYASLIFLGIYTAAFFWLKYRFLTEPDRINLLAYFKAEACTLSRFCPERPVAYLTENGWRWTPAEDLAPYLREPARLFFTRLAAEYVLYYLFLNIPVLVLVSLFFHRRAKRELHQENILRGEGILPPREVSRRLRREYGRGRLKLSRKVTLPRALEPRHVFVVGAAGTGKTVLLSRQIARLEKDGEKAVILDVKGDYTSRFYDPKRDLILNPLDRRSVVWMPLLDLEDPAQADGLAASFIPPIERSEGVEAYFRDAARDVLSSVFLVARAEGVMENRGLWEVISGGIEEVVKFLKRHPLGRKGLGHLVKTDSNQAAGIMSTLMQFCRVFEIMPDGEAVSLRSWVRKDGPGFLFLPIPPQYREALSPLLAAAVNVMLLEVLSWPDDLERRRFVFVDEMGAIQKLAALVEGLTTGRSKGLSLWIGIQDFGRIDALYGREIRETIWNNCASRVVLRVVAPETADYLSRALGEVEVEESRKTFSMGVEDVRDGFSFTRAPRMKRLITPSEITNLPDLKAILKMAEFPPTRDEIPLKTYKEKHPPFVPQEFSRLFAPKPAKLRETREEEKSVPPKKEEFVEEGEMSFKNEDSPKEEDLY